MLSTKPEYQWALVPDALADSPCAHKLGAKLMGADPEPPARHIALLKTGSSKAAQPMQLLESMLWAFQGMTRTNWIAASSVEAADVIVVHESDRDARIAEWRKLGKAVVVIASESPHAALNETVLIYPFRATQLFELLNRLDVELTSASTASGVFDSKLFKRTSGAPTGDTWNFIQALRLMREVKNADVWVVGRLEQAPVLWLKGDGSEYTVDPPTLQAIRLGDLSLSVLKLQRGAPPQAHRVLRSAVELGWFAGYHASPTELAPWLNTSVRYRMVRWPNFGLIRPLPFQIRLTAILAETALTVDEIATRAQISLEEATRTLNALATCDLLAAVVDADAEKAMGTRPAIAEPAGGIKSFVRLVRKRLGLS